MGGNMPEDLEITIKAVEDLTPAERERTQEVDRLSFSGDNGPGDIEWSENQWLVMGAVDDTIVSQICLLMREVDVGGQKITVGGVGGVATDPEHRQRGYAGKLLRASESFMRELDLPFGVLVCGEERMHWYASHGWVKIDNKTIFQNSGIDRELDGIMMILPLKDQPWPEGVLNLNGKPW
jgi:aminoglycoside 2'-N-acetyltransferase I